MTFLVMLNCYILCPGGEMADTPDLGSGAERRGGSSPLLGKQEASKVKYQLNSTEKRPKIL